MDAIERSRVIRFSEAQARMPGPSGERSSLLQRGTLSVKLSFPLSPNQQTPHEQDEVYFIIRGRGVLFRDGERDPFEPGDLLFVAAGIEHRVEDFSGDLAVCPAFYGPSGGDVPAPVAV